MRTYATNQIALLAYDPEEVEAEDIPEDMKSEEGTSYIVKIQVPGLKKGLTWNISGMTLEELEVTRQFFNYLFDTAEPVIRERDRVAEDAFARGDDSYIRSYRLTPELVIRKREAESHDQGLHNGLEDASERTGDGLDSD